MKHTDSASPSVCVCVRVFARCLPQIDYTSRSPLPHVKTAPEEVDGNERNVFTVDVFQDVFFFFFSFFIKSRMLQKQFVQLMQVV